METTNVLWYCRTQTVVHREIVVQAQKGTPVVVVHWRQHNGLMICDTVHRNYLT